MCKLFGRSFLDDECHDYDSIFFYMYQNLNRLLLWHGCSLFRLHLQVYIIGGDGTQKGAAVIYEVYNILEKNIKGCHIRMVPLEN